ncbi:Os10g0113201, partial [Oryza sativa Japonica Group]
LSKRLALGLGDVVQDAGVHHRGAAPRRALRPQRRVPAQLHPLSPAHLPQRPLLPHRVHLHLVRRRPNHGERQQLLQLLGGEVTDADGAREAQPVALLHAAPHALHVERRRHLLLGEREVVAARRHGRRPVDEEQVDVVHSEVAERLPRRRHDAAGVQVAAPELGGDEHVGAGGDEAAPDGLRDGLADAALRRVQPRRVEVAVAELDGAEQRRRGFLGGGEGERRRAHADARHGREQRARRHLR